MPQDLPRLEDFYLPVLTILEKLGGSGRSKRSTMA